MNNFLSLLILIVQLVFLVGKREKAGVQGGFLVLRPDMDVFQDYLDIIREGDFRENGGWAGKVEQETTFASGG